MERFVTLLNTHNVELMKDVGLIPYGMQRFGYYDAYITVRNDREYPYLNDEVAGLKPWVMPYYTGSYRLDAWIFVFLNARKIDVLNLYHTTLVSAVACFLYKLRNPRGLVYLKLDGGHTKEESVWWKRIFRGYAMMHGDYVSAEIEKRRDAVAESWGRGIDLVRNPYHPEELRPIVPFAQRKNVVMTVGRLGTPPKNSKLLLEAFRLAAPTLGGWTLLMVGPLEKKGCDFEKYVEDWFAQYPEMRDRVQFVGNIEDRERLGDLYEKAKVFVLCSRWESYGIAMMEAALKGDFLICSDLESLRELTDDFNFAGHFPSEDAVALSEQLVYYCGREDEMEEKGKRGYERFRDTCGLEYICGRIHQGLCQARQERREK